MNPYEPPESNPQATPAPPQEDRRRDRLASVLSGVLLTLFTAVQAFMSERADQAIAFGVFTAGIAYFTVRSALDSAKATRK